MSPLARVASAAAIALAACALSSCAHCARCEEMRIEVRPPCEDGFATEIKNNCWVREC